MILSHSNIIIQYYCDIIIGKSKKSCSQQLVVRELLTMGLLAGYLITKVTGIKEAYKKFIGLDAGMGTLLRPSMYGAFHRSSVYNKTENTQKVNLCGQICENSDIFAKNIDFPDVEPGDLVTFREAGAYGFSMSSVYNNRPRTAEVILEGDKARLIRKRETFDDLLRLYPKEILEEYSTSHVETNK